MFNQEQLAAIAAAMSVLQNSLQSNSPPQSANNNNIAAAVTVEQNLANGLHSVGAGLSSLAQIDGLTNPINHNSPHRQHHPHQHHVVTNNSIYTHQHDQSMPFKTSLGPGLSNGDSIASKHELGTSSVPGASIEHQLRPLHNPHEEVDFLSAATHSLHQPQISSQQLQASKQQQHHQQQSQHQQQPQQQPQQQQQALLNQFHPNLHHSEIRIAPSPPKQQHALVNQYHSQYQRQEINLTPSPPKHHLDNMAAKHELGLTGAAGVEHQIRQLQSQYEALDFLSSAPTNNTIQPHLSSQVHAKQQQALVNQFHPQLSHQQKTQLESSPPKQMHQQQHFTQQHHNQPQQQQQALVNQYQAQFQRRDLGLTQHSAAKPQHQFDQQQTAIRASQQPQLPSQSQPVLNTKATKPVSYSAIVAKSAGLINNSNSSTTQPMVNSSHNNINNNNNNNVNNSITSNFNLSNNHSHLKNSHHSNNNINIINSISNNNNNNNNNNCINTNLSINPSNNTPSNGSATNLLGFMGLYVGNLSPDLTKEQLEKIFSQYGEPVKAHRLIRSPVAFIKYENTESPRAAIDDLYGLLLPELTLNQDQPLKLHFDRNDAQLKANYRPIELPPEADNGECYGWRTTVCRRGKNCPKKHIPINRGIDFQMWMIKSTPTTTS